MRFYNLLFIALLSAQVWAEPARLMDVRLLNTNPAEHTTLVFDLSDPVQHELFILGKEGGKPERVVIDLPNTQLVGNIADPVNAPLLLNIRGAERNQNDLRVVLDLRQSVKASALLLKPAGRYGHRLVVTLEPPEQDYVGNFSAPVNAPAAKPAPRVAYAPPAPVVPPQQRQAQRQPAYTAPMTPHYAPVYQAPPQRPQSVAQYSPPAPARTSTTPAYRYTPPQAPVAPSRSAPVQAYAPPKPNLRGGNGRNVIVAVDAGHGGIDPGAVGSRGTYEKNVVLAISRELAAQIDQEAGMQAYLVRDGDYFLSLRERIDRARNAKADIFVSIHADASESAGSSLSGASVYMLSEKGASSEAARWLAERENRSDLLGGVSLNDKSDVLASILLDLSQTGTLEASSSLGEQILAPLSRSGAVYHRRVQQAAFMVLRSPDVPSVLVETAFISNPEEETKLSTPKWQSRTAQAVLQGVRSYFAKHAPPGTLLAQRYGLLARQ